MATRQSIGVIRHATIETQSRSSSMILPTECPVAIFGWVRRGMIEEAGRVSISLKRQLGSSKGKKKVGSLACKIRLIVDAYHFTRDRVLSHIVK